GSVQRARVSGSSSRSWKPTILAPLAITTIYNRGDALVVQLESFRWHPLRPLRVLRVLLRLRFFFPQSIRTGRDPETAPLRSTPDSLLLHANGNSVADGQNGRKQILRLVDQFIEFEDSLGLGVGVRFAQFATPENVVCDKKAAALQAREG